MRENILHNWLFSRNWNCNLNRFMTENCLIILYTTNLNVNLNMCKKENCLTILYSCNQWLVAVLAPYCYLKVASWTFMVHSALNRPVLEKWNFVEDSLKHLHIYHVGTFIKIYIKIKIKSWHLLYSSMTTRRIQKNPLSPLCYSGWFDQDKKNLK